MAKNAFDLKQQLNVFKEYSKAWKLKVNVNKSNVLIFSNGRNPPPQKKNLRFLYDPWQK